MGVGQSQLEQRAQEKPSSKVACREFSLVERAIAGGALISDANGRGTWQHPSLIATAADYTLLDTDFGAVVTTGAAQKTITLPAPVAGQTYTIKKVDSGAGTVKVDPGTGVLIDGQTEYIIATQWGFVVLKYNGTDWYIVGVG
jgi:hypothetical protein